VYIVELLAAPPPFFHNHVWVENSLFEDIRIEFDFFTSYGINERHDDLQGGSDDERDIDEYGKSKPFGIVILEER